MQKPFWAVLIATINGVSPYRMELELELKRNRRVLEGG